MTERPPIAAPAATGSQPWGRLGGAALVAITALGLALRLYHVEQWSWSTSEAATLRAVTQPAAGAEGFVGSAEASSPLVYLALRWLLDHGWLPLAEGWLRLPFVFVGSCTVPLLAFTTRRWLGVGGALVAAVVLAVHPWHVLASQTATPAVIASAFAWIAAACAERGALWGAVSAALLAGGCAPGGFWALLCVLPLARVERLAAALPVAALLAAGSGGFAAGAAFGWPTVLVAACGFLCGPLPVAWTLLGIGCGVGGWFGGDAMLAVPLWIVAVARGLAMVGSLLRVRLGMDAFSTRVVAVMPGCVLLSTLVVTTFLNATVHRGERSDWRRAAADAMRAAGPRGSLVVAAESGLLPLLSYLRPEHHRQPGDDPYPGRRVEPFVVSEGAKALVALQERATQQPTVLVLTTAEAAALQQDAAAAAQLAAAFRCVSAIAGPRCDGDAGLLVYVARQR